jgi:hypothetical protein
MSDGQNFSDYGVEQQAVMMSDYYALMNGAVATHQSTSGQYYGNTDIGPPSIQTYQHIIQLTK